MAGYSARQSSFTTGDTIEAADSNDEFNQILAAFHVSTGHTHDGTTAGDGGPLSTLYSNAISMGTGADTDIVLTFNANTSDGVITWMEDEDYFKFSDDILVNSTEKLQFRDTAIYLYSSADGQLDLVADTEIQIAATTVDINGNVDISGSLTLGGTAITSTAAELNLMDGGTSATSTTVADADRVVYNDAGTMKQVAVTDLDTYISATSKTLTNKTLTSPVLNTGVSGTAVADEDDMSSNSATKLATQQSIKAYVDAQITAEDLDVTSDSGTIAIDLDSETLTIAGGTGLDSSATSNTVTLAIDSTVATLTGSQTLTNKTLTSPVLNTGVSGTAVLDEDNFASDSATKLATQQSIKAYVDAVSTGVTSFVMEDDDGTEVTISNNKEIKYIGSGLTTNWTDTDNGTDGDPYDLTFTVDAAQTGITSILATDLKIGEDNETKIDFETADEIHFYANNTEQVYLADNIFGPQSDSDVDLGTTGVRWKDAYVDSLTTTANISVGGDLTVNGTTTTVNSTTVTIDDPIFTLGGDSAPGSDDNKDRGIEFRYHNGTAAKVGFFGWDDSATAFTFIPDASNSSEVFSGTVGNAVFGNITGTLQTAAQTNITSVGALDGGSITSGFGTIDTGSSNITTTGLISGGSLDIDDVLINGTTIGHTDDTDLITLADGAVTIAGTLEATGNITGTLATAAQTNITSTGALDGGSITSGFGAIDNGTSGIRTNTFTAETSIVPDASGGADLGSTSLEWGDLYIADDKKIYLGSDQNLSIEYDEDGNDTTAVVAAGGVSMAPHGSSAGNGTELRFQELAANGANYVGFKAPDAIAANKVFVLPNADGSDGQFLQTDGSLALSWADAGGGGEVNLVADGAISAQKPVLLTAAGKAAQVAETTTVASTTSNVFSTMDNSDTTGSEVQAAYESNSGAYAMVYKDTAGSSYGTAVAGTWSDGTITWGTPVVFESSAIDDTPTITAGGNRIHVTYRASDGVGGIRSASISGTTLTFAAETTWTSSFSAASGGLDEQAAGQIGRLGTAYDTNSNRYITAYDDAANSNYGTAVVSQLTDANTGAMTWGTPVVFNSASTDVKRHSVAYDSSTNRVLIAFRDAGDSNKGKGIVANITAGTNAVAFGSEVEFEAGATSYMVAVEDPNTDRILVLFRDEGDTNKGKATVATITGGTTNSVAFGTVATFESNNAEEYAAAYNPDDNKILVVWGDQVSRIGEAAVATVTGGTTNTVAFGSPATFDAAGTKGEYTSIWETGCAYDTVGDRFVIAYGDVDDSYHTKIIGCTVSGTTPSFGTAVKLQADGAGSYHHCIADPTGSAVYVAYKNGGASSRGYVHRITGTGTTVTDSATLNWSGTDATSYVTGVYDEDMARVTLFTSDTGTDLNSLTLLPEDGHQPLGYRSTYDTDNNYVVLHYQGGGSPQTFIKAISFNSGTGAYTAQSAATVLHTSTTTKSSHDLIYDPDANRAVTLYNDTSNSNEVTANVIQLGGTAAAPTVTIGSDVLLDSGDDGANLALTYDTTNNRVFAAYENTTEGLWKGAIGTVTAGTNSISFAGTATLWNASAGGNDYGEVVFDDVNDKIMFFYRDDDNSDALTYKIVTPGASSFSVATGGVLSSNDNRVIAGSGCFGASKGVLLGAWDTGNSNKVSYATTRFVSTTTSNLTKTNYLGVAKAAISDTATGTIVIPGGISEGHSSLTIGSRYFTNGAGTIGLAGNARGFEFLGKAISATQIQLQDREFEFYAEADGAITKGGPIDVSSGKIKAIVGNSIVLGSATTLSGTNTTEQLDSVYDTGSDRTVVVYKDTGNSNYGTAVVLQSGTDSVTAGTPVVFHSGVTTTAHYQAPSSIVYDPDTDRIVILFVGPSDYLYSVVGSITSGTNASSWGSVQTIDSSKSYQSPAISYDLGVDRVLIMGRQQSNGGRIAYWVGTVNGSSTNNITLGSEAYVVSANGGGRIYGVLYDTTNNIHIINYADYSNSSVRFKVATVTGGTTNTTAFVTTDAFAGGSGGYDNPRNGRISFDPDRTTSGETVFAYVWSAANDSNKTQAARINVTCTGASASTLRQSTIIEPGHDDLPEGNGGMDLTYDTSTDTHVYAAGNSDGLKLAAFTLTGDGGVTGAITVSGYTDNVMTTAAQTKGATLAFDSDTNKMILSYQDESSDYAKAKMITSPAVASTKTNFDGFAQFAASDGNLVAAKLDYNIDNNQSGLTAGSIYYLNDQTTLTTTSTSNQKVGVALTDTDLQIIKT